jgi:hypothetical protein
MIEYHLHCLAATAPGGSKSSSGVCKNCRGQIHFADFGEVEDDVDEKQAVTQTKRKIPKPSSMQRI